MNILNNLLLTDYHIIIKLFSIEDIAGRSLGLNLRSSSTQSSQKNPLCVCGRGCSKAPIVHGRYGAKGVVKPF